MSAVSHVRKSWATLATGLLLGFCLSRIGFSSYDEVAAMFRLEDARLIASFAFAAALLFFAWKLISSTTGTTWSPRKVHRGTVPGAAIFGLGWALCGACPSIAFVQVGECQMGGVLTLIGMLGGNFLYSVVHQRYFRWSTNSCLDD